MRALGVLVVALLCACSFAVDTSDLSGGNRPATDSGSPGDSSTDSATCNPEDCLSDVQTVPLADIAPCSATTTDKVGCRAKVAERCKAINPCCFHGGYGPVELPNATTATIVCLIDAAYDAPVTELTNENAKCLTSALASRECDVAAHASAKKRGHGTGILQKSDGTTATLLGIDNGGVDVQTATWADLATHDPGCTLADVESFACTRAVQRFCTTGDNESNLGGYGPVLFSTTDATVVCLW